MVSITVCRGGRRGGPALTLAEKHALIAQILTLLAGTDDPAMATARRQPRR